MAVHEDQRFGDAMADLLQKGLAALARGATKVKANAAVLKRRKALTQKFVSGEWGVELDGIESARQRDRL